MKILLAGTYAFDVFEKSFAGALEELGHDVTRFSWQDYLFGNWIRKSQAYFPNNGPATLRMNKDLVQVAQHVQPDVLFLWRATHIKPQTISLIKSKVACLVVSYNNDDPFGAPKLKAARWNQRFLWKWHIQSLKEVDLAYVFRPANLLEARAAGARNVELFMPYYTDIHTVETEKTKSCVERFKSDVSFIGHFEPDGRAEMLQALIEAGMDLRVYGSKHWRKTNIGGDFLSDKLFPPVYGADYVSAIRHSKICLCFLSKLNRDVYTCRCFEIPAAGGLLLCERTKEMQSLFEEDREAVYFSSKEELVEKARWLLDNPNVASEIAFRGSKRVRSDNHSALGRAKSISEKLSEMLLLRSQLNSAR